MRLIKPLTVKGYYTKHKDAEEWLKAWMVTAKAATWRSLGDVRRTYPRTTTATCDRASTITNYKDRGDNYLLMVANHYNTQTIYIRNFMTHEEYNSQSWKKRH